MTKKQTRLVVGLAAIAAVVIVAVVLVWRGREDSAGLPEPKGIVVDSAGGQVVAVAATGSRVFFVHTKVDKEKACDPPCYRSELRELGARGGQLLGTREGEPTLMAVGPSYSVWGASGLFQVTGLEGGVGRLLSSPGERAAVDATYAFFAGRDLSRVDLGTGKTETLVAGANAADVTIDDKSVYFVESRAGVLWRLLKDGGPRTPLAKELPGARRVAVGRGHAFVACEAEGRGASSVWDVAAGGTEKKKLASFDGVPVAIGVAPHGVDLVVWSGQGNAVLYKVGGSGGIDEVRRFAPAVYTLGTANPKAAEPTLVSTDRFVYVPSAAGLLQIER